MISPLLYHLQLKTQKSFSILSSPNYILQYLQSYMDRNRLWLMSRAQLEEFDEYRQKLYYQTYQKDVHDALLIKYYVNTIIYFIRKRPLARQNPYTAQKLIHTAVSLFKRYYLVNPMYSEEPTQAIICSLYISLKLNEYREDEIEKYAEHWKKKKKELDGLGTNLHYGDEDYNQRELKFLQGIGFHIGRSPLIQPLEAIADRIKNSINSSEIVGIFQRSLLKKLKKVYYDHSLTFVYPGPKIALCLVLDCLREMKLQNIGALLGVDLMKVIEDKEKSKQIEDLCVQISKLEQFDRHKHAEELKSIRDLTKSKKKNFQIPQYKKSPKFSARTFSQHFDD